MSGRKLGGGRVLGSGKNLSPNPSPLSKQRHTSLLSPSASSISLNSSASTSTPPTDNHDQDLVSRISLEQSNGSSSNGAASAAARASSKLVCPICNEEMVCWESL
jgi:rabenosyn-5